MRKPRAAVPATAPAVTAGNTPQSRFQAYMAAPATTAAKAADPERDIPIPAGFQFLRLFDGASAICIRENQKGGFYVVVELASKRRIAVPM